MTSPATAATAQVAGVRPTTTMSRGPRRPLRRLPARAAFYLQASIVVFFLAGSSAPTPLYAIYQREWAFSPITTTVVFGVYAVAVLGALLTVGSLSDHVGRRPVLIAAVVAQAVTMLAFVYAGSVPELLGARVAQGLSTGAALGAVGAGMLDHDKARGTLANAVSAPVGTALGALGSGLLVQYLPDPTRLVYLVLFAVFVAQAVGVVLMAESATPRPGAWSSLRPTLALPPSARQAFLLAAPALVAMWALVGFYGSLGPTLVTLVVGHGSFVLGGASLFVLAAFGGLTTLVLRNTVPRTSMALGTGALLGGVGLTLVAVNATAPALFFLGTALAGVGFGAGFPGVLRTVIPLAEPHERAGVLSLLFVVSYLSLGLPAILAGVLVVHGGGLQATARDYGAAVIALAALVLVATLRRRWRESRGARDTGCPRAQVCAQAG